MAPTLGAIDISLSLSTTMNGNIEIAGVVQPLEGHAAGERAIADDGDHAIVVFRIEQALGDRHAEGGGDGGAGMSGAEGVVNALIAREKAGEAALLPDGVEAILATRQQLVRIGLMADIPDEQIVRANRRRSAGDT